MADLVEAWKAKRSTRGPWGEPSLAIGADLVAETLSMASCASDDVVIVLETLAAAGAEGVSVGALSFPKLALAVLLLQISGLAQIVGGTLRLTAHGSRRLALPAAVVH